MRSMRLETESLVSISPLRTTTKTSSAGLFCRATAARQRCKSKGRLKDGMMTVTLIYLVVQGAINFKCSQ